MSVVCLVSQCVLVYAYIQHQLLQWLQIDPGESPESALVRELREELGIAVRSRVHGGGDARLVWQCWSDTFYRRMGNDILSHQGLRAPWMMSFLQTVPLILIHG